LIAKVPPSKAKLAQSAARKSLNRELYEVYRDYPKDVFGNLCKETEIHQ